MKVCNLDGCDELARRKYCCREHQLKARAVVHQRPAAAESRERRTILVIPDTQCKPGVPNDHLLWIHDWALHRYAGKPLTVVHLGDHWDMPSLSSYDKKGGKKMEGRRVSADIEAGNRGMEILTCPEGNCASDWRAQYASDWRAQPWDLHLLRGNHEHRITRAIEADAQVDGLLSLDMLKSPGWEVHDFLQYVPLHGITFSHFFYNMKTGRPLGGENLETRLKTVGAPFVAGHEQGLKVATRPVLGTLHRAIVAGSCYQHDEDYLGPQGQTYWRGVIVLNNVRPSSGEFASMEVELDYLSMKYEGHPLAEHVGVEL